MGTTTNKNATEAGDPTTNLNIVILRGTLSSTPVRRELPSGSTLLSYEVTTRGSVGPAESAPVTWLDPPARASSLESGDEVVVIGRVRRRFFRAGGATVSRTEVVATEVLPASHRKRIDRALSAVLVGVERWDTAS